MADEETTQQSLPGTAEDKVDWRARAEEAERARRAAEEKVAKAAADQKKRDDDAKRKKAEEDGKLKDHAEKLAEELKAKEERLSEYLKRDEAEVKRLFDALPKERRDQLATIKESLSVDKLLEFLRKEPGAEDTKDVDSDDKQPPNLQKGGDTTRIRGSYKPRYVEEIEDGLMKNVRMLPRTQWEKYDGGQTIRLTGKDWFNILRAKSDDPNMRGVLLNAENAAKRAASK